MPTINEAANDWLKDGTADKAPETVSTPAIEAADTSADVSAGQPRDEQGRFVSTSSSTASAEDATPKSVQGENQPAAEATATAVAAVEAAAADAGQTVEEFLEARRADGQTFKFPKDIELPYKRGTESGFMPITEVLKSPFFEKDYRHKTGEVAALKRQLDIEKARLAAEKTAIDEEREQLRAAMLDPEKLESYQQHYEQMRMNPVYRANVEAALKQRTTEAELNVRLEGERNEAIREAAQNLHDNIVEMGKQYPGVDPDRVRAIYSKALTAGDIEEITDESIHKVYKQEADYLTQSVSPLQAKVDELEARIAALSGAKAIETHNAKTDAALAKAKAAPKVAAVGNGTPVGTSTQPTQFQPFVSAALPEKIREWAKRT